jgi:hypothetical protein
VVAALTGTAFYHGMVAFALEQNGDSEGAELHGRLGTEILPDDAWSHHAVAHALYNKVCGVVSSPLCKRVAWQLLRCRES